MNIEDLIASMTPEIYQNMRDALALGKWGDGRLMTEEQRANSVEAIILYEHKNNVPEEERLGYVDTTNHRKKKAEKASDDDAQPLNFV